MKRKVLLTLLVVLYSVITVTAQNSASEKLYTQLDGANGVTILSFSQNAIELTNMFVDEDNEREVNGELKKVKLMICKEAEDKTIREVIKTFEKHPFSEVEEEKEHKDDSRVFVIRNGRKVKECHIVANDKESLLVFSFYGDFRIEGIDDLANKADNLK
ncbi:DUF4252 domain-containing protein [Marinilabilia sp.]|uniref:DUF4252 domain-containing protein n=1 Tax=Marinilabilia sp. TaxID=2021252 RepID=UPI0025B98D55|nr:DUF4252 domain-containing protein [Marinilabilia sp.]